MAVPLNVLIADDEPKIRQLLEQILTARGCEVREAGDGLEALAEFDRQPADVVITDLKMPKMTGQELLRELKHRDPLINVIVITAYPSVEGAVQSMQYGACDFITKPFDITQIQAILYRCQQRVSLTRQLRTAGEGMLKLEELNRRLAELNDLKSQFLAAISHEINTPLCLMSEWIYLLSDGTLGQLTVDQQGAVDVLIGAYERLHRLLQQLIDLMHGHEIVLRRQAVPLQELVQQAVTVLLPKASTRSITVTCQVPDAPVTVELDRQRISAAIEYLLDNAIKFNHDHGSVALDMSAASEAVEIRICDSGIGIPEGELDRVFTAFYQVDRRLNRSFDGAGVGLTLAKRYIELHGGSIALASEPEKGTTVRVVLPRLAIAATLPRPDASSL